MICPWLNVWLSIRASGFLILHSFTQLLCAKCCDKPWKYKLKVTQFTLKTIHYKVEKQMNRHFPCRVINTQTDTKDGTRNTQKGQPALCQCCRLSGAGAVEVATWRTGESTAGEGETHVQRPEVRKRSCGIPQSGWLDAGLRGRGRGWRDKADYLGGTQIDVGVWSFYWG